jgi:hypothetical protein
MSFFKVKDKNGNWVPPDTEEMVDQTFDPESAKAQSGIAIAGVIGDIETALDEIIAYQFNKINRNRKKQKIDAPQRVRRRFYQLFCFFRRKVSRMRHFVSSQALFDSFE